MWARSAAALAAAALCLYDDVPNAAERRREWLLGARFGTDASLSYCFDRKRLPISPTWAQYRLSQVNLDRRNRSIDYTGRDGAREAFDDFRCGRSMSIFTYFHHGVAPEDVSPGISWCTRGETDPRLATDHVIRFMQEANFSESVRQTTQEYMRSEAARQFATTYNSMTYRLREAEVKVICPCAKRPDEPQRKDCWPWELRFGFHRAPTIKSR